MEERLKRVLYHAEHAECLTYFEIEGKFDPDSITAYLRIAPERVRRIGDLRANGQPSKTASWRFGSVSGRETDTAAQMMETIRPLLAKEALLRQIKLQYDASLVLCVVPIVRYDESTPELAPSLAVMRFCLETGTELVIDLYVSCPDDLTAT
jgi:hypothetical protein